MKITDWLLDWVPTLFAFGAVTAIATYLVVAAIRSARKHRLQILKEKELASRPPGHFVFAKIADPILPMARGRKYEEPLDEALQARGFGSVTGAGTQTQSGQDNLVAWIGLDLDLSNLNEALEFTRQTLRELGAPPGSVLEYRVGENRMSVRIA